MELMTIKEAASELRVSAVTIRRHIATGRLPAVRIGRGIRIDRQHVERFVTPVAPTADQVAKPTGEGMILTSESPLWGIIGIIDDDGPTDVSTNTDAYLADAY